MRTIKVKVKIEALAGGGTHYVYPQEYWDCKLQPLAYESENDYASVKARKNAGNFTEFILCICPDDSHVINHPDFEVIDKLTADALGKKWTSPNPQTGKLFDINDHV